MEQEMPEETGAEMPEPDLEEEPDEPDRLGQAAEKIRRYIRKNYMKDISMQDAARMMNYSDAYFCKLFKQLAEIGVRIIHHPCRILHGNILHIIFPYIPAYLFSRLSKPVRLVRLLL